MEEELLSAKLALERAEAAKLALMGRFKRKSSSNSVTAGAGPLILILL